MTQDQVERAVAKFPGLTDEQLREALALGESVLTAYPESVDRTAHFRAMGQKMVDAASREIGLRTVERLLGTEIAR